MKKLQAAFGLAMKCYQYYIEKIYYDYSENFKPTLGSVMKL